MSENRENERQQYVNPYKQFSYYYPQSSQVYYPYQQRQIPQQPQMQEALQGMLPMEQSYIENILRLNLGKEVTVYMTFEKNTKTFSGIIEAAGRDHIILSDPESGERYLLLMVYLDYITFKEEINYSYPFQSTGQLSSYPPR